MQLKMFSEEACVTHDNKKSFRPAVVALGFCLVCSNLTIELYSRIYTCCSRDSSVFSRAMLILVNFYSTL
jgi:hypothetical protein